MSDESSKPASGSSSDGPGNRNGGGVFIAIGAIAGVFVGGYFGQPTAGLLAGLALGSLTALAIWFQGR